MQTDDILDLLRPLVAVVEADGTITSLRGGYGGFLGLDLENRIGSSVFDFIAPHDVDELATYFLESIERSSDELTLTLPFRVTISGGDGIDHPADIIPTGVEVGGETTRWVVVVVPLALSTAATRSLDAEMAGAPRDHVRRLLTEELAVDNEAYGSRWFLLDPDDLSITTSRDEDRAMAQVLRDVVTSGWRPWTDPDSPSAQAFDLDSLDPAIGAQARPRGWRKLVVAPVRVDHEVVAVYFQLGRLPGSFPLTEITTNVRVRIQGLVDVTALLITRWRSRDKLLAAASRDTLTGLANRATFSTALEQATTPAAVLYLDIDHFKSINDRLGHLAGDGVLVELGRRVQEEIQPGGLVARFGGDEFVALLKQTTIEDARTVAARVVATASAPMPDIDGLDTVTVSVGLAMVGADGDAVHAADRAMLQAKREGRDRLVIDDSVEALSS